MTKKGYWLFLLVFILIYTLIQVIAFDEALSLKLFITSIGSGLITIGLVYVFSRLRK